MIDIAILAIAISINLSLGLIVFLRNTKVSTTKIFFAACISIVVWSLFNYLIDHAATPNLRLASTKVTLLAGFNILYWLAIFTRYFETRKTSTLREKVSYIALWFIGSIFSASSLVTEGVSIQGSITNILVGPLYYLYVALLGGSLVLITYNLNKLRKASSPIISTQAKLISLGIIASVGIALLTNVIIPVAINDWQIAKLGPLVTVFFTGSVAYAIIKHGLFDIRLVVARLLAYVLVITSMGLAYGLIVFRVVDSFFPHAQSTIPQQVAYTIMAVFMAFTFQPVKHFFDHVTERIFFKDHYSSSALLANLSRLISSTLNIRTLTQSVLNELITTVHIQKAAIFITSEGKLQLLAQQDYQEISQLDTKTMAQFLTARDTYASDAEDGELSELMKQKEIAVIVPFANNQTVSGLIVLGNKQSGDVYTTQDLEVLEILGPELAVAIENALSYQQVSQFNETLRSEVNKATKELQAANEQLTRKNHQLEQLDKLKDEFISVTSHELRTPLTAIRGYLWMAMHAKRRDENFKQYMDRAYISSERLIGLVNDTLDISRIESGRVQLNPEPTKLPALTKQVVEELTPKALENQQKLTIKAASRLPQVMCDPDKIHQVLTNLIGNALKFTPPGGSITIQFYSDKKHLVTAITDTGPGISPEDQKRLFQKFSRLASTAGIPGTGLGLYLCQQFISLSKGKIWVDSQVGEGSTFFFSLPITEAKTAPSSTKPHIYHPI